MNTTNTINDPAVPESTSQAGSKGGHQSQGISRDNQNTQETIAAGSPRGGRPLLPCTQPGQAKVLRRILLLLLGLLGYIFSSRPSRDETCLRMHARGAREVEAKGNTGPGPVAGLLLALSLLLSLSLYLHLSP